MSAPLDVVLAYHQRTKHHLHRYAAGPGGLDWATQPDPFRRFAGSPRLELPLLGAVEQPRYADLYHPGRIAPQPLNLSTVAALLELSFGISAWKQYGHSRWALRCNPSSGNLHPTEAYVVVAGVAGVEDGVHHYVSRDHLLERRCSFAPGAPCLPPDCFLVGIGSIPWREAWKYGERAWRYCLHDAGHAIAAVRLAAAALGWRARWLCAWSDADLAALLGLDRDSDFGAAEREEPEALMLVAAGAAEGEVAVNACVRAARTGRWQGRANVLSPRHRHDWPVIGEVARVCIKPETREPTWQAPARPESLESDCTQSAVEIVKQRRSALGYDGVTGISARAFYRMLDITLPRPAVPPWDAVGWEPRVHLALFVHRVEGLAPGLYLFLRHERAAAALRAALNSEFEWARVEDCPAHLRLYRLATGDARPHAQTVACHQEIAADGAFSLGMLAEYEASLARGPWVYRELFWETGVLGQVLYLEAEAAGARGTGIGCYFDDAVHGWLRLKGRAFQDLYHFAVGAPVADARLQTLPPYAHLGR